MLQTPAVAIVCVLTASVLGAAGLKHGGRLAIFDVFPGDPQGDLNRTLYALGLALRTEHGQVHGAQTLEALLREAGFDPVELRPLPVPPHAVGMIVAHRAPETPA